MRITVLGAAGRTGREVVRQAREAGHDVTALVRDPAKLGREAVGVKVVPGDVTDPTAVDAAVAGSEAVVSALGPRGAREGGLLARAVPLVVDAMQRHGARRYVAVSGAGTVLPGDAPRALPDRVAAAVMGVAAKPLVADKRAEWDALRASKLEWVLVRPPRLTEGPRTGRYEVATQLALGRATVSRADVADFLLRCLREDEFVGQAPFIRGG